MKVKIMFANVLQGFVYYPTQGNTNSMLFSKFSIRDYVEYFTQKQPDILCIAELLIDDEHGNSYFADQISSSVNLPYRYILPTEQSWLYDDKLYGMGIFSKYPIVEQESFLLPNPNLEVIRPNGDHWYMHDKSAQFVRLNINNKAVSLFNLHYFPVHHFNENMQSAFMQPFLESLETTLLDRGDGTKTIICGDFNNKSCLLTDCLPTLFTEHGFTESIIAETTVVEKKEQYDHILVSPDLEVSMTHAEKFLSDHYSLETQLQF